MKNTDSDRVRLLHMAEAIEKIQRFVMDMTFDDYNKNDLVQSAVERQLEIIGEASAGISGDTRKLYKHIEWQKIKAFRNIIAHEYFGVSLIQVWNVVNKEIPVLKSNLKDILSI